MRLEMLACLNVAVESLTCLSSAITHAKLNAAHLKAAAGWFSRCQQADTKPEPLF